VTPKCKVIVGVQSLLLSTVIALPTFSIAKVADLNLFGRDEPMYKIYTKN
jgi:hypothetical protein